MKTLNILVILILAIFLNSCKDSNPKFITVINPDGSCYKEIQTTADSAFMVGDTAKSNPLSVDLDSAWKITWSYNSPEYQTNWPLKSWKHDTASKEPIKIKAKREFKSVSDMAVSFKLSHKHKWKNIKPNYSLDKKFRWFYTYYTYREVYPKIKTFDRVPFEKYLTKEEAEFWFNGKLDYIKGMNGIEIKEESEKIEQKFNYWFGQNIWEEEYEVLLNNYDLLKENKISNAQLLSAKDSIFNKNIKYMEFLSDNKKEEEKDFSWFLDEHFKTKVFSELYNKKDNPLKKYEESLSDREFMIYFETGMNYNLVMPGKISNSGNALIHGDTLSYNLSAYRMLYSDYDIIATSRKANIWAFVVSGIIVLLAVGSMFVKRR